MIYQRVDVTLKAMCFSSHDRHNFDCDTASTLNGLRHALLPASRAISQIPIQPQNTSFLKTSRGTTWSLFYVATIFLMGIVARSYAVKHL